MLLRGLLGHALLLEGGGGGEGLRPLLGWSCGCHRARNICGGVVKSRVIVSSFGSYLQTTLARRRSLRSSLRLINTFLCL